MMKYAEVKAKAETELKDLVLQLKKELLNLRFQRASGEAVNQSRFKHARRDIARAKTALRASKQ